MISAWTGAMLVITAVAATVAIPSATTAAGVNPHGTNPPVWAWAVVRQPTTDVSDLPPTDAGNSFHSTNGVQRNGTGQYTVTLHGVGAANGNALVSAMGNLPRLCVANTWAPVGSGPANEVIDVRCYDKTGLPTDSPFVVNWLSLSDSSGYLAYGADFSPTSNCGQASFSFDPLGGPIQTCLTHPNGLPTTFEMRIPHLGVAGGVAHVVALAQRGDVSGTSAGFCDLVNFRRVEFHLYDPDEFVDFHLLRAIRDAESAGLPLEHGVVHEECRDGGYRRRARCLPRRKPTADRVVLAGRQLLVLNRRGHHRHARRHR